MSNWQLPAALVASLVVGTGVAGFEVPQAGAGAELKSVVAGLQGLSLHDQCTGDYPPQPDTCLHQQRLEIRPHAVHDRDKGTGAAFGSRMRP